MDLMRDSMYSNLLTAKSRVTYIWYLRAGKTMTKHQQVFHLPVKLGKRVKVAKTVGITYVDDPGTIYLLWKISFS